MLWLSAIGFTRSTTENDSNGYKESWGIVSAGSVGNLGVAEDLLGACALLEKLVEAASEAFFEVPGGGDGQVEAGGNVGGRQMPFS